MTDIEAQRERAAADLARSVAYFDGGFHPVEDAKVSVLDFGFIRGDLTYDVVHVWDGRFFRLEDHLDRFIKSMEALRLQIPETKDDIRRILMECVKRSGFRNSYVGMVCLRGRPPLGSRDMRQCKNWLVAYALPFIWVVNEEKQKQGLKAIISQFTRIPTSSVDARIKNYHWLDMVRSLWEAYDRDADTALLLDIHGNVAEGPGFNVFAVLGDKVVTPQANVLEGITRKTVLELAGSIGMGTEIRDISANELLDADEVFITSTGGGVMGVSYIDDRVLSNGAPGPVTLQLRSAYWDRHKEDSLATPVPYDD